MKSIDGHKGLDNWFNTQVKAQETSDREKKQVTSNKEIALFQDAVELLTSADQSAADMDKRFGQVRLDKYSMSSGLTRSDKLEKTEDGFRLQIVDHDISGNSSTCVYHVQGDTVEAWKRESRLGRSHRTETLVEFTIDLAQNQVEMGEPTVTEEQIWTPTSQRLDNMADWNQAVQGMDSMADWNRAL